MFDLLRLLEDGQFHSGDQLGDALGISRSAVWKKVQKLEELGLDVQSIRGKGYRLAFPLEKLSVDAIWEKVHPEAASYVHRIDLRESVESTNSILLDAVATGQARSGSVCLAEQQTSGRGRRGRAWVSPYGTNLYLSLLWEFQQGAAQLEGLSLAAGVAVAEGLRKFGVQDVRLKWPNDVVVGKAKLGGILLEMTGDPAGRCQVVLGIGVNHRIPGQVLSGLEQPWCRLEDIMPGIGRNELAAGLVSEVVSMLNQFSLTGFIAYREKWEVLDAYRDCPVKVLVGSEEVAGIAKGVDQTGGLRLLDTSGRERILKGGEVSLRSLK